MFLFSQQFVNLIVQVSNPELPKTSWKKYVYMLSRRGNWEEGMGRRGQGEGDGELMLNAKVANTCLLILWELMTINPMET